MEEGVEQNEQNRRKIIFIIIFFLILVIGGAIFAYKSCEPRVKEGEETINFDEYSAFINANTRFTCEIIKDQELANDTTKMETRLKEIYEEYNFPIEDDPAMFEILNKYENDLEVTAIIKTNSNPCYGGSEPIFSGPSPWNSQ